MRAGRFLLFLLSVLVGLGAGLVYGWVINPPPYRDLPPDTLGADYKADYVLMVAEIYRQDGNLALAVRRLSVLSPDLPPARIVAEALLTARDLEYDPMDLETLSSLAQAVQVTGGVEVPAAEFTPPAPEGTP
jgi:hypothetical protein